MVTPSPTFRVPAGQNVLEKSQSVFSFYALPLYNVHKDVLVPLDDDSGISLPVNELFVPVALDPPHKRVDLQLLSFPQLLLLCVNLVIDTALVLLDLKNL